MSNTAMTENELLEIEETYPVGCQVEFLSGVYEGRIGAVYSSSTTTRSSSFLRTRAWCIQSSAAQTPSKEAG